MIDFRLIRYNDEMSPSAESTDRRFEPIPFIQYVQRILELASIAN